MDVNKLNNVNTKLSVFKLILIISAMCAICIISGCASELTSPLDLYGLYYEYSLVSDSDGQYIVLTKHIVSESDVKIPDSIYDFPVKKIGESTFADDDRIKSVTLGKNVEAIESNAFGGCTSLESVQFTESFTCIGDYAFKDCTALKSVSIPESVQSVGRGAFYGCTALEEVIIPDTLQSIGGRAFADTPWLNSKSKTEFVIVGDGVLIQYNGEKAGDDSKDEFEVKVPSNVVRIAGAFSGNTDIQKITLGKNVEEIGDMAFTGCTSLESVSIPSSVTDIGNDAFYGCNAIKLISLSENVEHIGNDAFAYCGAKLYVPRNSAAHKYCADNNIEYSFNDE